MSHCLRLGTLAAGIVLIGQIFFQTVFADIPENDPGIKPDLFISMDTGDKSEYAIVVEKETQKLVLYECNGSYKKIFNFKCSTGEISGIKTRSGDKKTPEGIYFFTGAFEKKYLSAVYGEMAFPMDYPNPMDRLNGRQGNSIWMHGTNKSIKDRDSNGCIVLANRDIKKLADYITINRTPIIVTDKVLYAKVESDAEVKRRLDVFLDKWNKTLLHGGYEDYFSFYDLESISGITWWNQWRDIREGFTKFEIPIHVYFKKMSIYKFGNVYTAIFDQEIQTDDQNLFAGTRKVYLKSKNNRFQIITDIYQTPKQKNKKKINPFISTCLELQAYQYAESEIEMLVERWLTAWVNKDIQAYGSCYASNFRFKRMDRNAWLKKKQRLNQKYKYIRVSKKDLVIKKGLKTSTATFIQTYESSGYRAIGKKKLLLKREDGQWKIFRERWKRI